MQEMAGPDGRRYKLSFTHIRPVAADMQGSLSNRKVIRGLTVCTIKIDGDLRSTGAAECSPLDNFSKAEGRWVALRRAFSGMREEDRPLIPIILKLYRESGARVPRKIKA